ncbi:MAG: hypothetical protein M5U09_23260 [Gammaproteobacteria bacterium]|nr:hypothetical protein [Gammaproteobacteria bacterium]
MQQLFNTVSPEQVLVPNIEHIKRDARTEYLRVLQFLELEDDQRVAIPSSEFGESAPLPEALALRQTDESNLASSGNPTITYRRNTIFILPSSTGKTSPDNEPGHGVAA